jgi:UDP-3-O-[3-hydroxymyristoyl] glucosamine N-acyltransferase
MELTAKQLAEKINAELDGNGDTVICNIAPVEVAGERNVTFISDSKHLRKLKNSHAAAVITSEQINEFTGTQLIVENVEEGLIKTLEIFAPSLNPPQKGIDKLAKVSPSSEVSVDACIKAFAVIENNVQIGAGTVIEKGVRVGENSVVGENCRLDDNVAVYHNCRIGNNVIIQANSTVGSTGFGYAQIDNQPRLIPHNGGVIIEDFVEIGANCCIDRAKFENTIIGAGTKIDNLVQIGHNVVIGKCCIIVAQVGIGGSTKIGNGVLIAGQVAIKDNINIGDNVTVAAKSLVTRNIDSKEVIYGIPADKMKNRQRIEVLIRRLPDYVKQLKDLSRKVNKIEAADDNNK